MGIGCRCGTEGDAGIDELLRVDGVGGEEDILRRTVAELLRKCGGGAEGGNELYASSAMVSGGERGHYGFEVGGAGELQLRVLRADRGSKDREGEESEQGSAHKATIV